MTAGTHTVEIVDPEWLGRPDGFAWWPAASLEAMIDKHQQHLLDQPGTLGVTHESAIVPEGFVPQVHSKGILETVDALAQVFDDQDRQLIIMKLAAMHPLLWATARDELGHSTKSRPAMAAVRAYGEELTEVIGRRIWLPVHTDVLPKVPGYQAWRFGNDRPYSTREKVLSALDALIAAVRTEWTLVRLRYAQDDHQAERILKAYQRTPLFEQRQLEATARQQAQSQRAFEEELRAADQAFELERLKELYPLYGEWNKLNRKQKKDLVWSKPMSSLAKEYGISDVAIRKQCVKSGILVPPRGYWLVTSRRSHDPTANIKKPT